MCVRRVLEDNANIKKLAERLERCAEVQAFNAGGDKEAWSIAHAFGDLEKSFLTVLEAQLPRLMDTTLEPSEIKDLLLDIGEEFRHILYHLKDMRFYRYLYEDASK
jgi:hypothetical protein